MKSKRALGYFTLSWIIFLALFNIIVFVTPQTVNTNKFSDIFWVGYIFITVEFVLQFICTAAALPKKMDKVFYKLPIISISYVCLILMLIVGTVFMIIPWMPVWLGIIICFVLLAANLIALLAAGFAAGAVAGIDKQVKKKTFFVKSLTVDAENLMNSAKSAELKAVAKKVYEAVRYSDPMSDVALMDTEDRIQKIFGEFAEAINNEDAEMAASVSRELLSQIDLRNKKCKMLK